MVQRKRNKYGDLVIPTAILITIWAATHPEDASTLIRWILVLVVGATAVIIGVMAYRKRVRGTLALPARTPPWQGEAQPAPAPPPRHATVGEVAAPATAWTPNLIRAIEWKRFEELCAAYFEATGQVVELTGLGADGGVDFYLHGAGERSAKPLVAVQCKAWNTHRVGVKAVRELLGSMTDVGCPRGLFITTSTYTPDAEQFATGKSIELLDARGVLALIRSLPAERQAELLALATQGDYRTPSCPGCGSKLILRTAERGSSQGSSFWGCRNYPTCRYTLRLRA